MKRFPASPFLARLGSRAAIMILLALTSISARAEKNAAAKTDGDSATNAAPKSTFVIPASPAEGRDPFYPLSHRLRTIPDSKNGGEVKPVSVTLTLKGVAKTQTGQLFALINDKTLKAGEEREITVGTSKARVLCVEIREDSAIVEINGARQELRLPPGL